MVIDTVEVRFPTLLDVAQQNVPLVKDKNVLKQLMKQIAQAPDEAMALWTLNTYAA